jgi:hypothetical protein
MGTWPSCGEFELYNARWCERPDYILSLVRSFMSALEQTNMVTAWRERAQKRRQLVQECRARLTNPLRRAAFNRLLTRAQRFVTVRENSKDHVIRLFMAWRRLLLARGIGCTPRACSAAEGVSSDLAG